MINESMRLVVVAVAVAVVEYTVFLKANKKYLNVQIYAFVSSLNKIINSQSDLR